MKALTWKSGTVALLFAIGAVLWGKNTPTEPSPSTKEFLKAHGSIHNDLRSMEYSRNEIKALKAELKADRKADRKLEVVADQRELAKSKADLVAAKKYLKADKKELLRAHRHEIKDARDEVAYNRAALHDAKKQLRKDLRTDNGVCVNPDAATVTRLMVKQEAAKLALNELKIERNNDKIALNEGIRDSQAGIATATFTYIEDGYAYIGNWMLK